MAKVHESTKALYHEALLRFEEAVREGDRERATKLRVVLLETFDNTVDDNATLMEENSG